MDFIDIHSHITWNVDDGIQTKEETIQAIQMAKKDGINSIVLTPHFVPGRSNQEDFDELTTAMNECIDVAKKYDIQAYLGCELFLNEDYLDMIEDQLFHSMNHSKYVLVEFDVRKEMNDNDSAEEKLYELLLRGYIPIIAHVERYFHKDIDIKRVEEWKKMGCFIQVNRTSLLSNNKKLKANVRSLIENNLVHFISTDTHSIEGKRICKMSDVYELLKEEYGSNNANLLCRDNALSILTNSKIQDTEIERKKSLFSKIFRRI